MAYHRKTWFPTSRYRTTTWKRWVIKFKAWESNYMHMEYWHVITQRQYEDVIKWKHFPRCWPFVRGIHRWPLDSPHKGQWCRALVFSLICAWTNGSANNRDTGDLIRHHGHCDVTCWFWMEITLAICQILFKHPSYIFHINAVVS